MSQKYLPSTSRDLDPTNYAWDSIVYQAGSPMLDSELNLTQDVLNKRSTLPSGIISYQGQDDSVGSFVFEKPYDDAEPPNANVNFTANSFVINAFKAMINGLVVDVRNTNATDDTNKIILDAPDFGSGAGNRGDFVFLEVWRREVTPSMSAKSRIKVIALLPNDTFTFSKGGQPDVVLTAVNGAPGVNEFQIGVSQAESARNLAYAINNKDGADAGLTIDGITTFAETRGTEFLFLTHSNGANANHSGGVSFTLSSSNEAGLRILNQSAGGSDGDGMTSNNKIFFAGNVLSPSGKDLDDNIQDSNVSVPSTRRVQVQYRIRSHINENLSEQIFGFENTGILAQGSQSGVVADKIFRRHPTDTGLWYAGEGTSLDSIALGTVDGYVYAIPLCYVFRRKYNSGAFGFSALNSFNTGALHNHDGNTLASNDYVDNVDQYHSDRPDGLFSDEISEFDVLDLRRRVYPRGIDFTSELNYQYHSLLDGENKTWFAKAHNIQNTGNGSGGASYSPLVCDVYGSTTNLQNVGEHRIAFDHIARRWSNEPTTERIFIIAKPANVAQVSTGVSVAGAGVGDFWYAGDVISVDLTSLDISGHLSLTTNNNQFLSGVNSPKLLDIGYCWHNDGDYNSAIEQQLKIQSVSGLGTNTVSITLEENAIDANGGMLGDPTYKLVGDATLGESNGSNKEIFIELIFDYHSIDRGLSGNAVSVPSPDPSGYPTGPSVLINDEPQNAFSLYNGQGNGNSPSISNVILNTKEVSLEYVYDQQTIELVSNTRESVYLPWRLYYNSSHLPVITDVSGGATDCTLDSLNTNYQHAESKLSWSISGGQPWAQGQRKMRIVALPIEPYPNDSITDSSVLVYYRRSAPKTVGSDFPLPQLVNVGDGGQVPDELNLQPLAMGQDVNLYLKTTEHYPFFNPTDEFATHQNASDYYEYKVLGSPEVILDDLKINTGSVSLPSFVPFVSSVNITLGDTTVNKVPRKDSESRVFYPTMEDASYFPSAFAKNMSGYHSNYKTTIPCLMKVVDDTHALYRKGEVVLVVFVKTNVWGQGISVDMRETVPDNHVAVCVYRTRNQLLLGE